MQHAPRRAATLLCALTLIALSGPSEAAILVIPEDYAILYTINDSTQTVQHRVIGTYNKAIQCRQDWAYTDLLATEGTTVEYGTGHTVRYSVSLGQGTLRVTEKNGTTIVKDDLYTCNSFALDVAPASLSSVGVVRFRMTATDAQGPCTTSDVAGAPGLAPHQFSIRGADKDVPIKASDPGLCFDLEYAGLGGSGLATCQERGWTSCIPFSGTLAGTVSLYGAGASEPSVMLSGSACDFMVVGGYCWSKNVTGDTAGAPRNVTPTWSPFDGVGRMAVTASAPVRDLTGAPVTTDAERAVGSWGAFAYTATQGA